MQSVGHVSTTKYLDTSCQILFLHYFCFCSFFIIKKVSMDTVQNLSIIKKSVHGPSFWDYYWSIKQLLVVVFLSYFSTISVFVHFSLFKKRCPWTPSMTGDAWTRSMKVVYGPGPKWGSMDPWSIIAFSLTVAFFIQSFSKP